MGKCSIIAFLVTLLLVQSAYAARNAPVKTTTTNTNVLDTTKKGVGVVAPITDKKNLVDGIEGAFAAVGDGVKEVLGTLGAGDVSG
ncbi:hypothetical protein SOVF_190540 [Spinacia oleracea]|nr:hypothetical protein SOVF_190540 [Spinacia oleracea]